MDTGTRPPEFFALLIGIDFYFEYVLAEGIRYPKLGGCVRDILHVRTFLTTSLRLPEKNIVALTATVEIGEDKPVEPEAQWPTYENMVAAFKQLTERAAPGDQIYIHYSGHGGRASTVFSELKGADALDETLVPLDIGKPGTRYLRDVEIHKLIRDMVDKGLIVTVVFDCCHSGGATRAAATAGLPGAVVRGIAAIDIIQRPRGSDVASPEALAAAWGAGDGRATRAAKTINNWQLEAEGYTLLAACRPNELAAEWPFDGRERNGALTYWLLDTLRQAPEGMTYQMLADRVVAKVHSQFATQTPMLQGNADLRIFGSGRMATRFASAVLKFDPAKSRVRLNAGEAHGLGVGAQLAIFPNGTVDFDRTENRLALVEVTDLEPVECWATITGTEQKPAAAIEAGAQAVLTAAAPAQVRLRRGVLIAVEDPGLRARLEAAVGSDGKGFVALAGADVPVDFQVAVNAAGELTIEDAADRPVPNLRPAVRAEASDAAARIVARLVHLAKFRNVQGLDMPDPATRAKLKVELTTDRPAAGGAAPVLRPGDKAVLKITNTQARNPANPDDPERVLNISVLDLMSNWSIAQIYPETGAFEPLDPGRTLSIDLEASLDEGSQTTTDILKVFATQATTSFQWLQLPALDQPAARGATRGAIADPLEAVLASVTAEQATTRAVKLARTGGNRGWTTAQVEMRVEAAGTAAPDASGAPDGGRGAGPAPVSTPSAPAAASAAGTANGKAATIRVEVTHGDLRVATFPLFVGHYQGDGIVSAEQEIDRQLCGRLTARRNLGLYPGALNSAHAFAPAPVSRNGPRPFPGAVVVGLGNVGHLAPGDLAGTFQRGLLELVSATAEGKITTALRPDGSIGISTLVIGGGDGGIGHRESIHAVLRAVNDANDLIAQRPRLSAPLPAIREVEFIEVYEDRAHSTFHVLGALREDERLDISPEIRGADGALRRVRFDEAPHWWRRIEILADKDKLHFKVLTDAARSEGYLSTTQLALVRRLIDDATAGTATAPGLSRTLYQLLVPNGLKAAAPQEGSLMLMLNEEAAGYPWELLENCQRSEPLVKRVRVLRQLVLGPGTFDATGRVISSEDVALVIGDTDTRGFEGQFSELPGAQAEAKAVAELLRESGFKAEPRIRPRPSDTLQLILTGSYRILHIAAHGVFEFREGPDGEATTGMVLGGGLYLTAQEIDQMTSVPELVFLNCCYLGKEKRQTKFHRIAANLASQFMRNGVRCVIASGWEVDDQAAQFFAEDFYKSMGDGQSFGDAVHCARRRTLERFPSVNTWGAFQCYGDPNYVLKARSDESADVAAAMQFGSVEELCLQLDAIRDDVSTAEDMKRLTALAGQIKQLRAQAAPRWLEKYARLGEAFGRAFAAVEDFEGAIASYRTGMAAARADATLAMHEQLMNVCARHAARKAIWHRGDDSFDAEAARIEIRDLIRQIEAWSAAYPTAERLNILGSAWKRLAMVEASRGDLMRMRGHLKQSVKRYVQAAERAAGDKAYPLSQVALGRLLGGWTSSAIRADAVASMDAIAALQSAAAPSTFWDSVYVADLAFLRMLHGIAAGTPKARVEEIADPYSVAIHRGASALEKQSPAETFDSVIVALEAYPLRTSDGAPTRAAQGAALVRDLCALLGFATPPQRAIRAPASPRPETSSRPTGGDHPVPPAE